MLSSHHGKIGQSAPPSASSETSQPCYNTDRDEIRINLSDSYASKMGNDDAMNSMDNTIRSPKNHTGKSTNGTDGFSPSAPSEAVTFAERLQRRDLFISTDLELLLKNTDQIAPFNTPLSPAIHSSLHSQVHRQNLHPSTLSSQSHQHPHSRHVRPAGTEGNHIDNLDTPPANCRVPLSLSRRASVAHAHAMMSPPSSAGLVKSATTHALYSGNEHLGNDAVSVNTPNPSHPNLDSPKPGAQQKGRSSLSGASRRHSVPNNLHNPSMNVDSSSINVAIQRLAMANGGMNCSYLLTPTESPFRNSVSADPTFYIDYATQLSSTVPSFIPPTSMDANFSSGVHPFDIMPNVGVAADPWNMGNANGMPPMPLSSSMSTATKSATIQYLQQLQQSMMRQPDMLGLSQLGRQQQSTQIVPIQQIQPIEGMFPQSKQQKAGQSGQGAQARRGSKTKVKRRVGSLPETAPTQSYMSAEMPWSALSGHTQQMAVQALLPSHHCSSIDSVSIATKQPTTARAYYHGPAPCGNPEPLYEYLASPTVVPGLEIIGHDYYGNYVQILPICPETTCSMNQDPIYLNLLQAIYAHTIPFLDLAPGSEEETQRLMNGTPSAITTQSIQPPFKNLLPVNVTAGNGSGLSESTGAHATFGNHNTLTSSVSSPSLQQPNSSSKLLRKSSMASISSASISSGRRSSTVSNPSLSNPARKKKNAPRTHPYKSTSVFKEDNPMVTQAILSQVGGLGDIGNSASVSATDPRHKVAEKMVHMDEAEYAVHYSKHHQSMNKSASTTAMCLAQTLTTSMTGSSLGPVNPSLLMSSSISAPSITNATVSGSVSNAISPLESIAAADFIRALSECNGGLNELGLHANESSPVVNNMTFTQDDLVSLENLMMMDSTAAAAVQAAAATAWPNWFDLSQLEKDVCQEGLTHQASAFSSTSCSLTNLPLSNSTTLASFATMSRDSTSTNLLLSSTTDLSMMDDLLDDEHRQDSTSISQSCQDSEMTLAIPASTAYHQNSTSQVLVFDQYPTPSHSQSENRPSDSSASSSSSSVSSLSTARGGNDSQNSELKRSISNDLSIPYATSLLTVLPFSVQHSHPIFPTRGNRRSGWYRSKSVASQGLSQITGVDYTTTCWYDVEQLQNVVRDSISFQESSGLKSLEDLTDPNPPQESA